MMLLPVREPDAEAVGGTARVFGLFIRPNRFPFEYNYLISPSHPDFEKVVIHSSQKLAFDPRLLKIKEALERL